MDSTKPTRKFDLEERLIDFSVMILDLVELLPDTRAGNLIANQLLRSGTSPASNYKEQGREVVCAVSRKQRLVL